MAYVVSPDFFGLPLGVVGRLIYLTGTLPGNVPYYLAFLISLYLMSENVSSSKAKYCKKE